MYGQHAIGPTTNSDLVAPPFIPGSLCTGINNPYSLACCWSCAFMGNIDTNMSVNVGLNVIAQGEVASAVVFTFYQGRKTLIFHTHQRKVGD